MVPSCSPTPPTHDAHSFEFDLDLLPSSGCCEEEEDPSRLEFPLPDLDAAQSSTSPPPPPQQQEVPSPPPAYASPCQQVPSPSNSLSPLAHSPTMFSPVDPPSASQKSPGGGNVPACQATASGFTTSLGGGGVGPRYAAIASPLPLVPPSSPYSPACRAGGPNNRRLSSTESTKTFSSAGSSSGGGGGGTLADTLAEFQELQSKIKFEQQQQQQDQAALPLPPPYQETKATIQVKIEPMDLLSQGGYSHHTAKRVSMDSNSSTASGDFGGFDLASLPPPPPAYSTSTAAERVARGMHHLQSSQGSSCEEELDMQTPQVKMEPSVISLAMEQAKNDIDDACRQLGIAAGKEQKPVK